jgi:hypothetical protein
MNEPTSSSSNTHWTTAAFRLLLVARGWNALSPLFGQYAIFVDVTHNTYVAQLSHRRYKTKIDAYLIRPVFLYDGELRYAI